MLGILKEDTIEKILEKNVVGRIGFSDKERIFIIPVTYLYTGKYVIAHSREGQKISILRKRPDVCFQVEEIDNLSNWRSVLGWGKYEEIADKKERYYALDLLLRKINRAHVSETALPEHSFDSGGHLVIPDELKTIVYRIHIKEMTGRFETGDDE